MARKRVLVTGAAGDLARQRLPVFHGRYDLVAVPMQTERYRRHRPPSDQQRTRGGLDVAIPRKKPSAADHARAVL